MSEDSTGDAPREISARQREMYDFIVRTIQARGFAPTMREIARELGIHSTNGVNDHLNRLVQKGYLKREHGTARSLVPQIGLETRSLPEIETSERAEILRELDTLYREVVVLTRHILTLRKRLAKGR